MLLATNENHFLKTENFGEIFFEVANNLFVLYIVYLQIYFRIFFNLLKPVTELIADKYLAESVCKKVISKLKKKINNRLFTSYSGAGTRFFRYLNIILNNSAFEYIYFFTYRSGIDYIDYSFEISNLK